MAKSLRSKWKRKMKAVKRERYGEKELKRLNDMLAKAEALEKEIKTEDEEDHEMSTTEKDDSVSFLKTTPRKIAVSTRRSRLDRETKTITATTTTTTSDEDELEKMIVDPIERIFNKRTMRDQFGNYPDWMNKRKMRTQQKKNKRLKKKALNLKRK